MREWLGLGMVFIPVGERLLARYSEPGRHYHDARHILACLRAFDEHTGNIRDPDAVEFVDSLPHTATGKVSKLLLRQQFKDYTLAQAPAAR